MTQHTKEIHVDLSAITGRAHITRDIPHAAYSTPEVQITVTLPAGDEPTYSEEPPTEADLAKAILTIQRHAARNRANAEIKRLLCMAHETYDPAALDALTRALIAQGFGK